MKKKYLATMGDSLIDYLVEMIKGEYDAKFAVRFEWWETNTEHKIFKNVDPLILQVSRITENEEGEKFLYVIDKTGEETLVRNTVEKAFDIVREGDKILCLGGYNCPYRGRGFYSPKGFVIVDPNSKLELSKFTIMEDVDEKIIDSEYTEFPDLERLYVKCDTYKELEKIENPEEQIVFDFTESQKTTSNAKNPDINEPRDEIKNAPNIYCGLLDENGKVIRILKTLLPAYPKCLRDEYLTLENITKLINQCKKLFNGDRITFMIAKQAAKKFGDYIKDENTDKVYKKIYFVVNSRTFELIEPNEIYCKEGDKAGIIDSERGVIIHAS